MRMARTFLALACVCTVLSLASAAQHGTGRRLLASSKPGPWRDWVVSGCLEPCPNLFLASWGFQCKLGLTHCCQTPNTLCTKISDYKSMPGPKDWTGNNLTATPAAPAPPPSPPPPPPPVMACAGSGKWYNASVSQYWSYPLCCSDPTADQTECVVYSGCRWEGLFAAYGDTKKSLDWVKQNNIAAYFSPPNDDNMKNWDKKWKKKKLRIRNPLTCQIMTVTIVDTCDDNDCPDPSGTGPGCCTAHANLNGGNLVDLEYFTSVRFWGGPIGVDEVRRLEFQVV
ncbi:hypothetical protein ABPG75_001250 [Micractinium tetrahymenae]